MASIQTKIQKVFTLSVFSGACIALFVFIFFAIVMFRNAAIIQTMVDEYSIIAQSQSLVLTYNEVTKNPSSSALRETYQSQKASLVGTIDRLSSIISSSASRNTLIGIQNTVQSVIRECDAGIQGIGKNEYVEISDHYAKANKYNEFVRENTRTLLQNELQYLAEYQKSLQVTLLVGIIINVGFFILLTTVMVWRARTFARSIALPLIRLTEYAKKIAFGEIRTEEKIEVGDPDDEVASLVQSIQTMIQSLAESFKAVQQANTNLATASETLEKRNKELKEMNDIMVGRELKMIELKKEIEALKKKG